MLPQTHQSTVLLAPEVRDDITKSSQASDMHAIALVLYDIMADPSKTSPNNNELNCKKVF